MKRYSQRHGSIYGKTSRYVYLGRDGWDGLINCDLSQAPGRYSERTSLAAAIACSEQLHGSKISC